jgi:CheY-like chemotaxis protein
MSEDEVIGRFEALAKFSLQLAAELEMRGLIDGISFTERLRQPPPLEDQVEYIRLSRLRLIEMADVLDQARASRLAHPRP